MEETKNSIKEALKEWLNYEIRRHTKTKNTQIF